MDRVIPAASAVVLDDAGRVLLVQRAHEPARGRWSLPGGKAEVGETLAATAAREVREETGLSIEVGEELWVLRVPAGDGRTYEIHDFAAQATGGELRAGDDASAVRWVAPHELSALDLTDDLADYLARVGIGPTEGC